MKLGVAAAAVMLLRMAWQVGQQHQQALTAQYNSTSYVY
jgi:cytochrome b561